METTKDPNISRPLSPLAEMDALRASLRAWIGDAKLYRLPAGMNSFDRGQLVSDRVSKIYSEIVESIKRMLETYGIDKSKAHAIIGPYGRKAGGKLGTGFDSDPAYCLVLCQSVIAQDAGPTYAADEGELGKLRMRLMTYTILLDRARSLMVDESEDTVGEKAGSVRMSVDKTLR